MVLLCLGNYIVVSFLAFGFRRAIPSLVVGLGYRGLKKKMKKCDRTGWKRDTDNENLFDISSNQLPCNFDLTENHEKSMRDSSA